MLIESEISTVTKLNEEYILYYGKRSRDYFPARLLFGVCVCVCVHFPFRRLTFNGELASAIRRKFRKAHFPASFARLTFGSRYEVIESL